MKKQEPGSSKRRDVGPVGIGILLLVIAVIAIGGALAWRNDGVRARYYVWQVCRGTEPGPSMSKLKEIGSDVNPYIAAKLPDADRNARMNLLSLLWQIGGKEAPAIAATCLDDPDPQIRASAVRVFHEWGKGTPGAIPLIYKKLDDPSELVQVVSCGALAIMTGRDLPAEVKVWRDYFKKNPGLLEQPEESPKK